MSRAVWRALASLAAGVVLLGHAAGAQPGDGLKRRADLGAAFAPPGAGGRARVASVAEGSALQQAGLRADDRILEIDGVAPRDAIHFGSQLLALRGDSVVRLAVDRAGTRLQIEAKVPAMRREALPGLETVYTSVANPSGVRQRAILTRPAGTARRLPAILFVPWFSCDSLEFPNGARPGMSEFIHRVARESGMVLLRVDKPGVGDSEGDCANSDLDTEIAGSRAGLELLRGHEWVDPSRIVLMGQSFSGAFLPVIARDIPVAGYVFINAGRAPGWSA